MTPEAKMPPKIPRPPETFPQLPPETVAVTLSTVYTAAAFALSAPVA